MASGRRHGLMILLGWAAMALPDSQSSHWPWHIASQPSGPVHCTALHCTTLPCTALLCTALGCTTLPCTALLCTALGCTALCCGVVNQPPAQPASSPVRRPWHSAPCPRELRTALYCPALIHLLTHARRLGLALTALLNPGNGGPGVALLRCSTRATTLRQHHLVYPSTKPLATAICLETQVSLADTAVSCEKLQSDWSHILSNALGHWLCRTLIGIDHADQGSYHVYDYNSLKPTVARQQPYRLLSRGGFPRTTSVSNCRSYPFCTTLQGMLDPVGENDTNFQVNIKFISLSFQWTDHT